MGKPKRQANIKIGWVSRPGADDIASGMVGGSGVSVRLGHQSAGASLPSFQMLPTSGAF